MSEDFQPDGVVSITAGRFVEEAPALDTYPPSTGSNDHPWTRGWPGPDGLIHAVGIDNRGDLATILAADLARIGS